MSVKAFISAEAHLAKLGFTVQQAKAFIESNLSKPDVIFATARQYGVTTNMLNEISGYSNDVIRNYFDASGKESAELDYTSLVINSDLGDLEKFVSLNERSGVLSNEALKEKVIPLLTLKEDYQTVFESFYPEFQPKDGIYDAEELGVGNLINVPATSDSEESIFYGSLINIFSAIDESELSLINASTLDKKSIEFQQIIRDALHTVPNSIVWNDERLAEIVTHEAANIINQYWTSNLVGTLDHSYLGIAAFQL